MKNHWAIFGANGGMGSACASVLQSRNETVSQFTRQDLDFLDTNAVSAFDLSGFTHVINCTGTTRGTYQGFLKNQPENIAEQITVNLTNNLLLLKNFITTNPTGHYTWIGSVVSKSPRPFHSVYGCTKAASTFATNLIQLEARTAKITEVRLGLVATNFRYTNYNGSKTQQEVAEEYSAGNALAPEYCAVQIIDGILEKKQLIEVA